MKKLILIPGLLIALASATAAMADLSTPRIDQRENKQQNRIQQGIRSGELTPQEAHRLGAQQYHINRLEQAAKADGIVTPGERRRLMHQQDMANRNINRAKNNRLDMR
jgi:uncharacterized membrane protein YebE (DUF533 family)